MPKNLPKNLPSISAEVLMPDIEDNSNRESLKENSAIDHENTDDYPEGNALDVMNSEGIEP